MANEKNLFPHNNFPFRLEYTEGNDKKICWFESQDHLDKHISRYKLDRRTLKTYCRDEQPTEPSKKNTRGVEQKPKPKSVGSSSTVPKRKPKLDTIGNPSRNPRRKKSK